MALTESKAHESIRGTFRSAPVAGGAMIWQGAMLAFDGGFLVPASTATGLVPAGVAYQVVNNVDGADGDRRCKYRKELIEAENSAGADEITYDDIGSLCYFVDDDTVARTDGGGTRSAAGKVDSINPTNGKPRVDFL